MYIGTLSKLDKQPHRNLEELSQAGAKGGDQVSPGEVVVPSIGCEEAR
jgi:hypothetical protein